MRMKRRHRQGQCLYCWCCRCCWFTVATIILIASSMQLTWECLETRRRVNS